MNLLEKGARQAVKNCMRIKQRDKVVIITDHDTKTIANAIKKQVEKITQKIEFFNLEDFGKRPVNYPNEIRKAIRNATASFFIAQAYPGELETFRHYMLHQVAKKKIRHAHMVNVKRHMMEKSMIINYKRVQTFTQKVYNILKRSRIIYVYTLKGTRLKVILTKNYKWIKEDGIITRIANLPAGEVFTSPYRISGTVVVDGVIGDYFSKKYGILTKTPVIIKIRQNRAVKVRCKNKALQRDFEKVLKKYPNSNRVGEFALGTNTYLKELVGDLHQDEKFPSVHIAFGDPYSDETGVKWQCKTHVDCVIPKTSVIVDNKLIMREGKYTIK